MNKSGRWALMRRMVLRRADGDIYMRRLRIIQTPWFAVYFHRFDAPDPGLDLHDHPWTFTSVVLRGGYVEEVADTRHVRKWGGERRYRLPGSAHTMRLDQCHTISELLRIPTYTLVLCGPRRRVWGFYEPGGWVRSQSYASERRSVYTEGVQP